MKKALYLLPVIGLLFGCDNIGEDDRYIEVDQVKPERRVLLEEFTGQRCTNCPAAHAVIEKLEEQYGSDLIVVSIHAGANAIASPAGLMQPAGNEYADHWDIKAYPCGMVDRNSGVLNVGEWASAIRNDMSKSADVDIVLNASLADDGQSISVTTQLLSSAAVKGSLQLWVTEDSIVALQIDGSNRIPDYVHNNVFRAAVNGLWGADVSLTPNVYSISTNTIAVDELWNTEHLNIVGFVYNDSGILQVDKCKVAFEQQQ